MEMRKIKVAMLAPYLTRSKGSGSVTDVEKTIEYLSYRDDIELHVVTIGNKNIQFKKGDLDVHVIKKSLPYPFSIPSIVWHLRRKTIEVNPDIVHAEMTTAPYSTAAALIRNRYPTLLTVLGVVHKEIKYQKGIGLIFYTLLHKPNERYVISKIPHIIIITPSIKNLISKWTNSKIYVVPDGIEFEKIWGFQPRKSDNSDVLFLSSLEKLKGVDVLIKSLPMVLNSVPDLSVYIAGRGPQEAELKSLVKELNLEAHVKFLGFISDEEEKYGYYKSCKVVVAPSRWDCQPYAVTEGAACGKPIIASDMSNPALLDDGKIGFIFQSENAVDLASKIIKLLTDDKLRDEMGKAALEKAKECDWNKIADRHVEIYKEVIADFHERKESGKIKK
jgi:glycosyltransferase involved in cell wall biosynthesis